jgi:FkbM family methyltransferase
MSRVARIGARLRRVRGERQRRRIERRLAGPKLLRAFAQAHAEVFFIEIGANDGEQYDHLTPYLRSPGWSGVMVEPEPHVFERLRRNYGGLGRIALVNAAIAERDGPLPFHHLPPVADPEAEGLPEWYDAIGSFSRESVLAHPELPADAGARLVTSEVRGITFETLCREQRVAALDLLAIDTEGYDAAILRQIDFHLHRPRLVIYEHFHMAAGERRGCREVMRDAGYETMEEGLDTFCLLPRTNERLTRTWRNLRPAVPAATAEEEWAKAKAGTSR